MTHYFQDLSRRFHSQKHTLDIKICYIINIDNMFDIYVLIQCIPDIGFYFLFEKRDLFFGLIIFLFLIFFSVFGLNVHFGKLENNELII